MAKFSVFGVTKKGFIHSFDNAKSLLKQALIPIALHIVAFSLMIRNITFDQNVAEGQSPVTYNTNAEFLIGMVVFVVATIVLTFLFTDQARSILLDEKETSFWDKVFSKDESQETAQEIISENAPSLFSRLKDFLKTPYGIAACIFIGYLIVRNGLNQIVALMVAFVPPYVSLVIVIANMLFLIWLIRFGVAHIPAAINYPIKDFVAKVKGFKFSFYLIFLMMTVLIPVAGGGFVVMALVLEVANVLNIPPDFSIAAIGSFLYVVSMVILNAASIFALDEVMQAKDDEKETS